MKVLFLDQTAELSGGELSLFAEVTNLPFESSVLLFENGPLCEMFAQAGITTEVVPASPRALRVRRETGAFAALLASPGLIKTVFAITSRARKHDIIYANSQKAFVVGALAAVITGRPLIWRLRDVLHAESYSSALRRVVVFLANWKAKRVIVNSEMTGHAFVLAGGDASKVSVVYPGIDENPFSAISSATIESIRTELGAGATTLIGVFGRLSEWKGQAVFIDAIAQLSGVTGVIVGAALFGEEIYAAKLHLKVKALGLADKIRFLGFRNDIPALMRSMDVIIHSSITPEPFGRVVVEGMLAGKPVVASAAGGVLEILEHGKTGWLYEPGNSEALVKTLKDVLADESRTAEIASVGQAHARATFTVVATARNIDKILRLR
jgi:glycosyltransferase involved in cell wall biosynthesis